MLEQLIFWDKLVFEWINQWGQSSFLDAVLPYWRHKLFWFPLYLFIFSFLLLNFKRQGIVILAFTAMAIGAADMVSSKIVKPVVGRSRPCHADTRTQSTRVLVRCGPGKSFPSSHATNHFAVAMVLSMILGRRFRWVWWGLFFWAFSISYGQVYVGLHYPLDVMGGAVLGCLLAWPFGRLCSRGMYFIDQ